MRITIIVPVLIFLFSCTERDIYKPLQGFWVSVDYVSRKPFQTLTISTADTTLYGAIPFLIETNQYGAYPYIDPADTLHGHFEAYDPHWNTDFMLKPEGDTLVQIFSLGKADERKMKYIRMDSLKMWREVIFSDLQLQIDLPRANESDNLKLRRRSLVVDLFFGPLKESLVDEHPAIARDSTLLQDYDVLFSSDELERLLRNEQAKLFEDERDSILVVLNADREIPEAQIHQWVTRVKSFNTNFKVWRRYIDVDRRKLLYRDIAR